MTAHLRELAEFGGRPLPQPDAEPLLSIEKLVADLKAEARIEEDVLELQRGIAEGREGLDELTAWAIMIFGKKFERARDGAYEVDRFLRDQQTRLFTLEAYHNAYQFKGILVGELPKDRSNPVVQSRDCSGTPLGASKGLYILTEDGSPILYFSISDKFRSGDRMPIPNDFGRSVRDPQVLTRHGHETYIPNGFVPDLLVRPAEGKIIHHPSSHHSMILTAGSAVEAVLEQASGYKLLNFTNGTRDLLASIAQQHI
jgi:hypothetical protein